MSLQVHCDQCNKSLFDMQRDRTVAEAMSFTLWTNSAAERWDSWDSSRRDFCNEGCAGAYFLEQQRAEPAS